MEIFTADAETFEYEAEETELPGTEIPEEDFSQLTDGTDDTHAETEEISYSELATKGMVIGFKVCGTALIISLGIAVIIKILKIH